MKTAFFSKLALLTCLFAFLSFASVRAQTMDERIDDISTEVYAIDFGYNGTGALGDYVFQVATTTPLDLNLLANLTNQLSASHNSHKTRPPIIINMSFGLADFEDAPDVSELIANCQALISIDNQISSLISDLSGALNSGNTESIQQLAGEIAATVPAGSSFAAALAASWLTE
ncbi:MAG: hypothetical protein AAF570_14870 [Bacteroidota bacterium]